MPVTPTAGDVAAGDAARPAARGRSRRRCATIAPGPPRPSRDARRSRVDGPRGDGAGCGRLGVDQDADRRGRADVEAESERHRVGALSAAMRTLSMKRLTRSPSTGFQVSPSTLEMRADDARRRRSARMSRDIVDADAGVGEDRHVSADGLARGARSEPSTRLAGHRAGDERSTSASEEKTALLARDLDRAAVERGRELGVDVEEQLEVGRGRAWRAAAARRRQSRLPTGPCRRRRGR